MAEFGADIGEEGAQRFGELDRQMVRIGAPPNMVDILNFAGESSFEAVFSRRVPGKFEGFDVSFPSLEDLVEMKQAAGRPQDIADIDRLRRAN